MDQLEAKIDLKFESLKESVISSIPSTKEPEAKSWAEKVMSEINQPTNPEHIFENLAKQVANTQKQITSDREERENNVIIFNIPEQKVKSSEKDKSFFESLCSEHLQLEEFTNIKLTRLGVQKEKYQRPLKVVFSESWDKRKFLSNLYKLKDIATFKNLRVSHDMNEQDRDENKKLLKKAHQMNEIEKPKNFRYKVRGPPWSMKIVKVYPKTGSTNP